MAMDDTLVAAENLMRGAGGYWQEHPDWPSAAWREEVANEETRQGYWFWVVSRIAEENEK
jgi:hypothetical protein